MTLQFDCAYRYRGGFALQARFEAGAGVTALCGPSGSGKTTILNLVAGLLRPHRGRITLDGRVLVDVDAGVWTPVHRRGVGVVFQEHLLFPHRTVRGNLEYGLRRRPQRRLELKRVVEELELGDLMERDPRTLSGGQARRVAIGRALLRGPSLLMLDEPWTGLDETLRDRVLAMVGRCIEEWGIPTLLVSHERDVVRAMTTRVVEVEAGQVHAPPDVTPTADAGGAGP